MTELLAPAGSYESLVAAVNAGADAVYMGGSRFGARAFADNPQEDKFIEGLHYAHLHGAKVYMTVNTLFKDKELSELVDFILPYYREGVDAVLVQDVGVLKVLREEFPDLPVHASTQMTVANVYSAKLLKECGITRVVPARELSLAEVKRIKEEAEIEVETFVHGALCYSYSGQCLMSSLIGGRSGNRGRCAQTCRLDYHTDEWEGNLLSLKDLCALDILPDLIDAGIDSFKIEGRMKSPRYTAGVTEVWRKYIDLYLAKGRNGYHVDKKDREMLSDLFDRGGFTNGYYYEHNGPDMMAWDPKKARLSQEELYSYLDEKYVNVVKKIPVKGDAIIKLGAKIQLSARAFGKFACVSADAPDAARTKALSEADIRKQLEKTGSTMWEWKSLKIDTDEKAFVPMGVLNEMRRQVLDELMKEVLDEYKRTL